MRQKRIIMIIVFTLLFQINIKDIYSEDVNNLAPTAKSSILIDGNTGRVLFSKNANEKLPMASTTKIMTALVVLDNKDINEKIKVKKEYVGIEGSSIYLSEDEEISIKDLLYGLMLRSGNDSATALAYEVGESIEGFSNLMNKKAKDIGATNSNFVNPHGLTEDNHYSTAYDLAIITREAMKHPEFREISKTKTWTVDRAENKHFYNKNKTLWQYDGGNGGKTGFTKVAGRCLVSTANRNGIQLISVVIDDSNWFNDCYSLMDYGFENYKSFVIHSKDQFIKSVDLINGDNDKVNVMTKEELIIPLTKEEREKIKIVAKLPSELNAPVKQGESIGYLQVLLDGKLVATTELVSKSKIEKKSIQNKLIKALKNII